MLRKIKQIVTILLVLFSAIPGIALAKNRYIPIDLVSGILPELELSINQKSFNLDLARTQDIRIKLKVKDLFQSVDRINSFNVSLYEINGSERTFISSQNLTVFKGSRNTRIISLGAGHFETPTKDIELEVYDTRGTLINVYRTSIAAFNLDSQIAGVRDLDLEAADCDGDSFDECHIDYLFKKISFEAKPQRQISTRVIKGEDGLYKVTIPVPRSKFKFLGRKVRRKVADSVITGTTTGTGGVSASGASVTDYNISDSTIQDSTLNGITTFTNGEIFFRGIGNVQEGYVLSVLANGRATWVAATPGPQGDPGTPGPTGPQGPRGFAGTDATVTNGAELNNGLTFTANGFIQDPTINGNINVNNGGIITVTNGNVVASEFHGRLFNGDVFNGGVFNGTFYGDGSNLTGIITANGTTTNTYNTYNNGTISYTNGSTVTINNGTVFNFNNGSTTNYNNGSTVYFNNGSTVYLNGSTFEGDLTINGIVTADEYHARLFNGDVFNGGVFNGTFYGDGSNLTGIITTNGTTTNTYNTYNNGSITYTNGSTTSYNNGTSSYFNNGSVLYFNGGMIEDALLNGDTIIDNGTLTITTSTPTAGYVLATDSNGLATWQDLASLSSNGDDLGNHTATSDLNLASNSIINIDNAELANLRATNSITINMTSPTTDLQVNGSATFGYPSLNTIAVGDNAADTSDGSIINAFGSGTARFNNGSIVNAFGNSAAYENEATIVDAFGNAAAYSNNGGILAAFGNAAAYKNIGSIVVAVGNSAAYQNNGTTLVGIGNAAGYRNEGDNTNAIGNAAAYYNNGDFLNAIGSSAGYNNNGDHVVAIGYTAGYGNNGDDAIFIGRNSGYSNNGVGAIAIGKDTLYKSVGNYNIAIGYETGSDLNNGGSNILIGQDIEANDNNGSNQLNIGNTIFGDLANGNIGIGTTDTSSKLVVNGDLVANTINGTFIGNGSGLSSFNGSLLNGMISNAIISSLSAPDGSPNPALSVDNNGSVGIGIITPSAKLHVNGSIMIADGSENNGYVLSSDANGLATWVSSASLSGTSDDLGNHTATTDLNLDNNNIVNGGTVTATSFNGTYIGDGSGLTGVNASSMDADSLDFSELKDAMTLDTTTTIDMDSNSADINFDSGTLYIDNGGRVGINDSTPLFTLDIDDTSTDSYAIAALKNNTISSNSTTNYGVVIFDNYHNVENGATNSGIVKSIDARTFHDGNGTLANAIGLNAVTGLFRTSGPEAQINNNYGVYSNIYSNGTGHIANSYAFYSRFQNINGGTLGNGYGLYIADVEGSTNQYGVYQASSTDENYFAGNTGIGYTSPSSKLHVNGQVLATSFNGTFIGDGSALTGVASSINELSDATVSSSSTLLGSSSYSDDGSDNQNVALGNGSLTSATSAYRNTGVGYKALSSVTTRWDNTAVGAYALNGNTTGYINTAIGAYSMYKNAGGWGNTALGYNTLYENTSGNQNVAIGGRSLLNNTTGYSNISIGYNSLLDNTNGQSNTAIGSPALYKNITGDYNVALGSYTLFENTTGENNTSVGSYAGADNTTGNGNTAVGFRALKEQETGLNNTAIGTDSARGVAGQSFSNGIFLGYRSGYAITTGDNNTLLGYKAGDSITSGNSNIILGYNADTLSATDSNKLNIGDTIYGDLANGEIALGIATANPSAVLHVNGSFMYTDGSETNGYVLSTDNNGLATWVSSASLSGTGDDLGNHTATTDLNLSSNSITNADNGNFANLIVSNSLNIKKPDSNVDFEVNGSALIGYPSLYTTAIGTNAAIANTGMSVEAIGYQTAKNNIGAVVSALGWESALNNNGDYVNAMGLNTAKENIGDRVNALGMYAGEYNEGNDVNAFGRLTGRYNNGNYLNAMGESAALNNIGGEVNAIGFHTAENNTAYHVNAIGSYAAYQAEGMNIEALGHSAAYQSNGTGIVAVGFQTLYGNNGDYNIAIGSEAGELHNEGSFNIMIGHEAEVPDPDDDYQLNIGDTIYGDLANGEIALGVASSNPRATLQINGSFLYSDGSEVNGYVLSTDNNGLATWVSSASLSGTGDDLGNHTATSNLDLASYTINNIDRIGIGTDNTTTSAIYVIGDATRDPDLILDQNGFFNDASVKYLNNGVILAEVGYKRLTDRLRFNYDQDDDGNGDLYIMSGTETFLVMKNNGNLGLGYTNPSSKLHVNGQVLATTFNGTYYGDGSNLTGISGGGALNDLSDAKAGTTSTQPLYIGTNAGSSDSPSNSTASVGIGMNALQNNDSNDYYNTAVGARALEANDGDYNTAVGYHSMLVNDTGYGNTAHGIFTLYSNTTGYYNTAVGISALENNTNGYYNTGIGASTLKDTTTGIYNTALGGGAARNNITGSDNTALGTSALYNNKDGDNNVAVGYSALNHMTNGNANVAIGHNAGFGNSGSSEFSNGTIIGHLAGYWLTTGDNNILVGYRAGDNLTTGSSNIVIGDDVNAPSATGSNQLNIGDTIYGDLANGEIALGIATTNPSAALQVNGSFVYTDGTETDGYILTTDGNGLATWASAAAISLTGDDLGNHTATDNLDLANYEINNIRKLGIGNGSSSNDAIYVKGNANLDADLVLDQNGYFNDASVKYLNNGVILAEVGYKRLTDRLRFNYDQDGDGNGDLYIMSGTDTFLVMKNNGDLGLGYTNPSAKLHVNGGILATTINGTLYGDGSNITGVTASPAGSHTQIQFNNSNSLGASPYLTWNGAVNSFTAGHTSSATGSNSTALGYLSNAGGNYSTAIGRSANSGGANAMAIGYQADASGDDSKAIGTDAFSNGASSLALGRLTTAEGDYSSAIGYSITAVGVSATAVGRSTSANGDYASSFGYLSKASNLSSTAIGRSSEALADYGSAFGYSATANGDYSVAIGMLSSTTGDSSIAIGRSANANGSYAVALGDNTLANGANSFAFGSNLTSNARNSMTIGRGNSSVDTLTNMTSNSIILGINSNFPTLFIGGGDGTNTTGNVGIATTNPSAKLEVNGGVLATTFNGTFYGDGSNLTGIAGGSPAGTNTQIQFNNSGSFGASSNLTWNGTNSAFTAGSSSVASNTAAVAFGSSCTASGNSAFCAGMTNTASGNRSVTLGEDNTATANLTVSIGWGNDTLSAASHAYGSHNTSNGSYAMSLGYSNVSTGTSSIAMGRYTSATADDAIAIGHGQWNDPMVNSTSDSLAVGFNSNAATLFVGTSAGGSTTGNVGIADITPTYKLDVNGTFRAYGITDSSDERYKEDIRPLGSVLDKLTQLRGVIYKWKDKLAHGEQDNIGFIAQEVEPHFPELVSTDSEGYKSVAYGKMTAVLTEAIKELKSENDLLKEELCKKDPSYSFCDSE